MAKTFLDVTCRLFDLYLSSACFSYVIDVGMSTQQHSSTTCLYVFPGGHDLGWRGLKAVELYDPRTDTWTPGPSLPVALPFAGECFMDFECIHQTFPLKMMQHQGPRTHSWGYKFVLVEVNCTCG